MRLRSMRPLYGANKYGSRSVVVAEFVPAEPGLVADRAWMAEFLRHLARARPGASASESGARADSSDASTEGPASLGEFIARIAVSLQSWVGYPVARSGLLGVDPASRTEAVFFEFCFFRLAGVTAQLAIELMLEAFRGRSARWGASGDEKLRVFVENCVLQPAGVQFIRAAEARGIPWHVTIEAETLLDFGQGKKQQRAWKHFTGSTSYLAATLCKQKQHATALFRAHGLPVPKQAVVLDETAAVNAARGIGFPVVVKPSATDCGIAVRVGLTSETEVKQAFAVARKHGSVLVESLLPGEHHRITIVNGRFTSARLQKPAHVVGDGVRTIRAIVDAENQVRVPKGWQKIPADAESELALAKQGHRLDDVIAAGKEVRLRNQANLSTGGTTEEVTERTHPDNVRMALRAAAVIGVDVAGLDFITPDISRSYLESGGGICEINTSPGFVLGEEHVVMRDWFAEGEDGRIPVIALLVNRSSAAPDALSARLGAFLAKEHGPVCRATRDGVWLDESKIAAGDYSGAKGALLGIAEPTAGALVVEFDAKGVLENGTGFDHCTAVVVERGAAPAPTAPGSEYEVALGVLRGSAGALLSERGELVSGAESGAAPAPWEREVVRKLCEALA